MSNTRHSTATQVSAALFRGAAFQALALGFAYPSSVVVQQLKTRWNVLLNGRRHWPIGVRQSFHLTSSLLPHIDGDTLELEHVRLFGPVARCPLHETAYGDAGRLLGRSACLADIAGFYLAFGLHPADSNAHREDHIGLELEFMSLLNVKEAYAIVEGRRDAVEVTHTAQQRFVQDHLGTWIDAWIVQLRHCTPHPFYTALGESLCDLVHAEATRLQVSPIPVGGPVVDTLMGGDTLQCPYAVNDQG